MFMVNGHLAALLFQLRCSGRQEGTRAGGGGDLVSFDDVSAKYGVHFPRAARMSEPCFSKLVNSVAPFLPPKGVPPASRVFIALRYDAGASYVDMLAPYGVSKSSFYNTVWDFTDTMLCAPDPQMRMPLWNAAWRQRSATGFQQRADSPLKKVIGAMDGIAIRQEHLTTFEVSCPRDYCNLEGFFSLNVQAVCHSNYQFMWMSCRTPGSAHDSTALAVSDLRRLLSERTNPVITALLAESLCIAADEAYADSDLLAVPWPGGGGGDMWRDA